MRHAYLLAILWIILGFAPCGAQTGAAPNPPGEADYRLGPEDGIQVQIWGRPDLTGTATLDFAGKVQLPLVGEIDAKGRTPGELSRYLTDRYQLLDPSIPEVVITVAQYNSLSVSVIGEVRSPGRYGYRELPDLWSVLLSAGGATATADLAHVQVVHKEEKEGEPHTTTYDLSRGIENSPGKALLVLRPKDTIVVPSLAANALAGDKFQVMGAVRSPGMYRIGTADDVIQAIALSGGALPEADLRRVRLTRATPNGTMSYELNLQDYLTRGREIPKVSIRPGDTITIPQGRSGLRNATTVVGPLISVVVSTLSVAIALRR